MVNYSKLIEDSININTQSDKNNSNNSNSNGMGSSVYSNAAINKLLWSEDGKKLFIGDAKGVVHAFKVYIYVHACIMFA